MLIKNANKIVLKLGSATVIDGKGIFKKMGNFLLRYKKYGKGKLCNCLIRCDRLGQKYLKIKKEN